MSDDPKQPPARQADLGTVVQPPTAPSAPAAPPATAPRQGDLGTVVQPPTSPSAPAAPARQADLGTMVQPATVQGPAPAGRPPTSPTVRERGDGDSFVGQVLGGYEVVRKLAEGGMGVVYEGRHTKLGRRGAIKLLKLEYCQSDDVVERFYQEARAVNEIHHENIVDIYDFGRDADGRVFFVMEFLEGESLGARLARGPLTFAEALPILEQVIRALKAAHDKGFVHRDLKPDNIWLKHRDDGTVDVRLLDFGIAKLVGLEGAKEKLTRTGAIIGTPTYMSPEQINGAATVDARTDVYSLGIIVYELFAGVTPFQGESLAAIITGHLFTEPPPLTELPPALGVPETLPQIIGRMLAKDVGERYQSVSEVLSDLRAVAQQREPTVASRLDRERPRTQATGIPSASERAAVPVAAPARRRWLLPVAGLLVAAGGAAAAVVVMGGGDKGAATPAPAARAVDGGAPSTGPDRATPTPTPAAPAIDYDQVGRDARVVLRTSLGDTEPRVRAHGSDGVGAIKDGESEPKLLTLATSDPDAEVRGHAAAALGALGATGARKALRGAEDDAARPLRAWYAGALARLGDKDARKRLIKYAQDKDLAVAFRAAMVLAEISPAGDDDAIDALTRLAAREAELNDVAPYAGAVLLTRLAALQHDRARDVLYQLVDGGDELARLAAAEGLAKLGDEAALPALKRTLDDPASRNRLVAAVALIPLGDYAGYDLLNEKLRDQDPEARRLAARGLGEIGETASVPALLPLLQDADGTVRVASAVALVFIVGLDPRLLAQASVDWAKGALASEDWAVRQAAAGVLGDMDEAAAVPLLAQAILDPDRNVRRAAARSARKMKSPDAAKAVADAALAEQDPEVQADQVRALGTIADVATRPALEQLARDDGSVGVLASGSLIAVGEMTAKARLDQAIVDRKVELRQTAVEAAVLANNPVVVPTLATGVQDRVFDVRFASAEGLARYKAEAAVATPVLEEGLRQKNLGIQGRARAALLGFGQAPAAGAGPAELLGSPDPAIRESAALELAALPWDQARPLVRRMLADPDARVRERALDVVETGAPAQRPEAIKLYKTVLDDASPAVRAKAQGRLARIAPPVAAPTTRPTPTPTPASPPDAGAAPAITPDAGAAQAPADTTGVDAAAAEAESARAEAVAAAAALAPIATELETALAAPAEDDEDIKNVKVLVRSAKDVRDQVNEARDRAKRAAAKAEAEAKATPSPAAEARAAEARRAADEADALAKATVAATEKLDDRADEYAASEESNVEMLVTAADAAIASGKLSDARRDLDKAAKQASASGTAYPPIKFSYGRLYDAQAKRAKDPADKRKLLEKAQQSYDAFVASGSGPKVARARERSEEIAEELAELDASQETE